MWGGRLARQLPAKQLGPEREARIKARVRDEIGRLSLNQLREARSLTQTSLAELLGTPQGGISRLERRADMYVSTLRNYIRAMAENLELPPCFPTGQWRFRSFRTWNTRRTLEGAGDYPDFQGESQA